MNATLTLLLPLALANPPVPPGCGPCLPGMAGFPAPPAQAIAPPCPHGPPAPLLAARLVAPPGVRMTVNPGTPAARQFDALTTIGFRPGYAYRLQVSNLPGFPEAVLYPVLEVRGTLVPRPGMKYMDYPAPIFLTTTDIEKVMAGGMITKVVYLEDPSRAVPLQTTADQPIEVGDRTEDEAMLAAVDNGRLVAILRIGDRVPDGEELARSAVPGTILLPGEERLEAPGVPPYLRWCGAPLYDPLLGPKPTPEECLTDGGDTGPRIGLGPFNRLGGLNPTDVALEYTAHGKRRVTTSNAVCICAPRFVVRRADLLPSGLQGLFGLDATHNLVHRAVASTNIPPMAVANRVKPVVNATRLRAALTISREGIHGFIGLSAPQMQYTSYGLLAVGTFVQPEEITSHPNEMLVTKEVDPKGEVQIGDVVTFTIRYHNNTRSPATDLLLSDSLSGRLEYIPGSAQSDRPANVTTTANEAGSVIVRFEIPGPIPPGQKGVVKFQARVR